MSVPKLRFKEFDCEFEKNKLVAYTKWSSGGTPSKDNDEYWNGDIPLISGASMHTNRLYESEVKITKLGLQKGSKLAPKNSILILVRGSMLFNKIPMGIPMDDVAFNQDVKCIQANEKLNTDFLFQWFSAKENIIQNKVTSTGIGAGKLDTADLQNLEIAVPSKSEQTKIASFLSRVDEKIQQLNQKHELLNQYKKGMMQKLFSQQIRFKADDGGEFGEWELRNFDDVLSTVSIRNNQIQANKILDKGEIPVVDQGQRYIAGYTNETSKVLKPKEAFIIFGDHTTFLKYVAFPFVIGADGVKVLEAKRSDFIKYIYYYLIFNNIQPEGYKRHFSIFREMEIKLPCLAEQTKIANFLSAIDQKIAVVAEQIEQAKQWKKGLLQQMFV